MSERNALLNQRPIPTELIRLAKRDRNKKRPYLFVNLLQGKHIPVSPGKSLQLFHLLAEKLYRRFPGERLLVVGFAETATAIGAGIACAGPEGTVFIQTTREQLPGEDYLYFTEAHSHAIDQKLIQTRLRTLLEETDRVVFAEDEVTTGNTIKNIMTLLRKEYPELSLCFGIVSILNGMPEDAVMALEAEGIGCVSLVKLPDGDFEKEIAHIAYAEALDHPIMEVTKKLLAERNELMGKAESRRGLLASAYAVHCEAMGEQLLRKIGDDALGQLKGKSILVLGTEEFMFPALCAARLLETQIEGVEVRFHATSRSPILPSVEEGYPLFARYELRSFYDEDRVTYVYNLQKYDQVFVITDAKEPSVRGENTLMAALESVGCNNISIIYWKEERDEKFL